MKNLYRPIHDKNGPQIDTPDEDFFLEDDTMPTAHLIDSENARRNAGDAEKGKKSSKKGKESVSFQGLPPFTQSSRNVQAPALAPPPQSV